MKSAVTVAAGVAHPLDPLGREEIAEAARIVREERDLEERVRFVEVSLHEPAKEAVLAFTEGDEIEREAFVVLLDPEDGRTYEAIVSLSRRRLSGWRHVPGVQPPITYGEYVESERAVKADPRFRETLRRRGIDDLELVTVDSWSVGHFGLEEQTRLRLANALAYVRTRIDDNGYARPVEGVIAVVDLNRMEVIRVEDHGVVPLPPNPGNYTPEAMGALRDDLRPLEISQPAGPSFTLDGNEVRWQRWRFRVGFTPREGLVLHTLAYEDDGRVRPVLYRASYSELVVPYGDPSPTQYRKNAFDVGEYGMGTSTNSLELGCDCLGEIRYLDAAVCDTRGRPVEIANAICIHEEDAGLLWKHFDWRSGDVQVRRSRRLVVSSIATSANYEYGFYWYLYQDGTIGSEVKLTGIVSTGALPPGEEPRYGTLVAPQLQAPNHQHFFSVRLDMAVDGERNSVYEVETEPAPEGPENPYGNAFVRRATLLRREADAQRTVEPRTARCWEIVNHGVLNALGQPVAYRLVPGENTLPFARPGASILARAGFITRHLWVTPYEPGERFAAGEYPNQHPGGAGLPEWTRANRPIDNRDIVVWYTFGSHHLPRPEDWPVMPVMTIGFSLRPSGFFARNPALDVPPPDGHGDACHAS